MAKKIDWNIDKKICKKYNITQNEALALLYLSQEVNFKDDFEALSERGLITASYIGSELKSYSLMDEGIDIINSIMVESSTKSNIDVMDIILNMQSLFPEGKKDGTTQYWRGNKKELKTRLLAFFEKYGEYDPSVIIKATEAYVNAFKTQGDFKNMRLLKYFIWKRDVKSGEVEESSDLLSFIENEGEDVFTNKDWATNLRV